MILEQTLLKHVWGLCTYSKVRVFKKNCKFEITAAKEQVFRLAHNKWAIATQKQFTTHQVCGKNRKPASVGPGTTITLEPGCKIQPATRNGDIYFCLFVDKRSGYMRAYTSKTKMVS